MTSVSLKPSCEEYFENLVSHLNWKVLHPVRCLSERDHDRGAERKSRDRRFVLRLHHRNCDRASTVQNYLTFERGQVTRNLLF